MNVNTSSKWNKIKLEDICSKVTDGTHDTPKIINFGYPLIKGKDISKGYIDFENCEHISEKEHIHIIKRSKPEYGDILFANIGNSIGDCVRVNTKIPFSIKNVALFKPDATKVFPRYLFYIASSRQFIGEILSIKSGAAQPFVSLATLRNHKVKIPPLPTQQKIAQILSAYDDLIENNLKRIKLLEEMAQQTYEEWFVRMKFPNHKTTPIDAETGLPEGWENKKLIDGCELVMGQSPKSEFYNTKEQGLPFHQGVKDYGFRFPANASWSTEGKRIAEKGDILFSVRAPVGRLNIAIEKIILGRGLSAIRDKEGYQSFLFYQLQKIFFEEDMLGGGAIFSSVTKNDMCRIELLRPSKVLLEKFNSLALTIDKNIENLYRQNQHLKEARDILLPRLMTGMINVDKITIPNLKTSPSESEHA